MTPEQEDSAFYQWWDAPKDAADALDEKDRRIEELERDYDELQDAGAMAQEGDHRRIMRLIVALQTIANLSLMTAWRSSGIARAALKVDERLR